MANNVFISFRYSDGIAYKEELSKKFENCDDTLDFSEDEDRSKYTEETIKDFLYAKLRRSSVTIILLTPNAISHEKNFLGQYDDWMYDEIRYSLEDRENNRTNGLIAVYTPEAEQYLMYDSQHICKMCGRTRMTKTIKDVDNLFRKNMMNVKEKYKLNKCIDVYDSNFDSYCSLVAYDDFIVNFEKYIKIAKDKRDNVYKYDITKRLQ